MADKTSQTHWIDSVADVPRYCEQILKEAPLLSTWLPEQVRDQSIELTCNVSSDSNRSCRLTADTKVIVIDLEGINLSRTGAITIISIATNDNVYLFDITTLGSECVSTLTTTLLQNLSVLKLLFDCRKDVDALFYQFQATIHPLCDLQVSCLTYLLPPDRWDYLIGMAKCFGDRFLDLFSSDELRIKEAVGSKTFDNKGGDPQLWSRRPIDPDLVAYSAIDVRHTLTAMYRISAESIVMGCQVGCLRRDRAVIAREPAPPSALCDFKDLLEVIERPLIRHVQGTSHMPGAIQPKCDFCGVLGHTISSCYCYIAQQQQQLQPYRGPHQYYSGWSPPQRTSDPTRSSWGMTFSSSSWQSASGSSHGGDGNSPSRSVGSSLSTPMQQSPCHRQKACYTCGGVGHMSRNCPSRLHNVRQQ